MFTFCTRTVYLGADFYSFCAQSYIFSDSNSDCLAVDISEDLPQILGRQRLFENPWKNSATFYYRVTADYKKMNGEDFKEIVERKQRTTEDLLKAYSDSSVSSVKYALAVKYQKDAKNSSYKDDYVAVNKIINDVTGDIILVPVLNNLVMVNEIRAFKIQQIDYADRFAVFSTIHNQLSPDDFVNQEAAEFLKTYYSYKTLYEKLKSLCEYGLSEDTIKIVLGQIPDDDEIKSYYSLGPQRLKALGYSTTKIKRELGIVTFSWELLRQEIYSSFREGEKYTLSSLKLKLRDIYISINYQSTPKATDIEKWFKIKEVQNTEIIDGKKKRVRYYELLKSKRDLLEERLVD